MAAQWFIDAFPYIFLVVYVGIGIIFIIKDTILLIIRHKRNKHDDDKDC